MQEAASRLAGIVSETLSACAVLHESVERANSGADTQRQYATETATAMEQMSAAVLEVARSAATASDNAVETRVNAEQGSGIVSETMEAINDVQRKTVDMTQAMNALGEQAEGIGRVMTVITDIADQTNLLALNAAIEAARAGDAGRGFAVVADEVRKLAEKTMLATKEVSEVIGAIQRSATENIRAIGETTEVVNRSNDLSRAAGESLVRILELSANTASQVQSIATASEEQSATSEQINRGTAEVNRLATENSEDMERANQAVGELNVLANRINELVESLKNG